jgi:DeoR/GlpR family transcriptional regulator of sugar metabolism
MCESVCMIGSTSPKRPVVPAERRRIILEFLRERGSISVSEVEEQFAISPMTARRDLALLAETGHARRTHGGAMLPELAAHEDSFMSRMEQDAGVKERLARAVAATVTPDETIFIDSSSTAFFVMRELVELAIPLTVLTNAEPVMTLIGSADVPQVELVGIGGTFRKLTRSFVGAHAIAMIEHFFVDRFIFSVKGIEMQGYLTDPDPLEAEVKRAMVHRSRSVVLVAQPQKFDERGMNVVVPVTEVGTAFLFQPPSEGVRVLEAAGTQVITV